MRAQIFRWSKAFSKKIISKKIKRQKQLFSYSINGCLLLRITSILFYIVHEINGLDIQCWCQESHQQKKKKIIKPKKTVYQDIHNHIYNNIIFLKFLYFLKYVITSD